MDLGVVVSIGRQSSGQAVNRTCEVCRRSATMDSGGSTEMASGLQVLHRASVSRTSVDATLAAVEKADTTIAIVNPKVPRAFGDAMIDNM